MNAFAVPFVPSRLRRAVCGLLAAAVAACVWTWFDGWRLAVLSAAWAGAAVWAWREDAPRIVRLTVDADGGALLSFDNGESAPAELLSGSLISPALCILRWRCGGRVRYQAVWPDAAAREARRRLRVWARFGRP